MRGGRGKENRWKQENTNSELPSGWEERDGGVLGARPSGERRGDGQKLRFAAGSRPDLPVLFTGPNAAPAGPRCHVTSIDSRCLLRVNGLNSHWAR